MGFLIDMIKVGQGDAFLITIDLSNGTERYVLVDAGPESSAEEVVKHVNTYAPAGLDLIIGTHLHEDHVGGLPMVLQKCRIKQNAPLAINIPPVLQNRWSPLRKSLEGYRKIAKFDRLAKALDMVEGINAAANNVAKIVSVKAGMQWPCESVTLKFLSPTDELLALAWDDADLLPVVQQQMAEKIAEAWLEHQNALTDAPKTEPENDSSVVFELLYKGTSQALFTGDAGAAVLKVVTSKETKYPFLKVPHHGSETGLDEELVKRFSATTAYIPVGDNQHGHPDREVLKLLKKQGSHFYCSDKTKSCKGDCRNQFLTLCHKHEREFHKGWNSINTEPCARVTSV
ncbi:MAG TPA: MBL fold metallo-hydrolase [Clostridia bacterium]|nr:MBL fold metallo-hydrolase [Clostridia bacterium]